MPLTDNEELIFEVLEIKDQETRINELKKILTDLSDNEDLHVKNRRGHTPLWVAVQNNDSKSLKLLFKAKANVNDKNSYGFTALMLAIKNNYQTCAEILIRAGAKIDAEIEYSERNAWEMAIKNENFSIVKWLLEKKVKMTMIHPLIHHIFKNQATDLLDLLLTHYSDQDYINRIFEGAAYYGDISTVKSLFDRVPYEVKKYALNYTTLGNHFDVVAELHSRMIISKDEFQVLVECAIKNNEIGYLKKLHLTQLTALNLNELLFISVEKNCTFALKKLIAGKADVNAVLDGKTLLDIAIRNDSVDTISILLDKKADPNLSSRGRMPLSIAIEENNLNIMHNLLEAKANPNKETNGVWSEVLYDIESNNFPLYTAMEIDDIPMLKLLIEYKADLHHPKVGKMMHDAVEWGHIDSVEFLIEAKVDLSNVSNHFERSSPDTDPVQFAECVSVITAALANHPFKKDKSFCLSRLFNMNTHVNSSETEEVKYIPLKRLEKY